MPNRIADLRSDTVTRPDSPMYAAMVSATVGDDIHGDDPSVNELQERFASLVGKEAALFVPSGSMGNSIAITAWTRRGDEVIIPSECHIFRYECGSASFLAGVELVEVDSSTGAPDPAEVRRRYKSGGFHSSRSSLLTFENTHNYRGGLVSPKCLLEEAAAFARENGMQIHMDGARLWNASIATGQSMAELASVSDSVMCCLSKGLGCPVGSLLAGPADFIGEAKRLRKIFGGSMRQAGVLAGAGIYAIGHNFSRLAEDHARAKRLAATLGELPWAELDLEMVHTNIVIAQVPGRQAQLVQELAEKRGIRLFALNDYEIRLVTHKDVNDEDINHAVDVLASLKVT